MTQLRASSLLVIGVACAAALACTGPAAGESVFSGGKVTVGADKGDDDDDTRAPSSSSSGAAAGADEFFGNVPYDYDKNPALQNADDRNTGAHATQVPLGGKECAKAGCHLDTGPQWAISGTVFSAKTGGTGVAKVQVGILTPDNKISEVYTDAQGHFWLRSDTPPPAGSKVAVRKTSADKSIVMITPLPAPPAGGNCNSGGCHGETNQIYVQ